jgi:hypothetical protein
LDERQRSEAWLEARGRRVVASAASIDVEREWRMPPVVAVHCVPSLTPERYEEVVRRLTKGKSRIDSLSDLPFDGLLVHATAQTEDGFLVFDVFESEEAVTGFNEAMKTIPREVGIEEPPSFYPAHTFISTASA